MAGSPQSYARCAGPLEGVVGPPFQIHTNLKLTKLTDLTSATSRSKVLIVPDKDADGLDAGVIIHRTLTALGAEASSIHVHLVSKGNSVHDEQEREAMKAQDPKYIIIVDQGSRPAPSVVDTPGVKCLIIDHHLSDEFPRDAMVRLMLLRYSPTD